ncbi:MAG: guanylate kinase [Acidimicrobiales bacterium]
MLIGPGGAGKGTVSRALVARDPKLWLSRSWTTRPRRPGEAEDAYVYVDTEAFGARVAADGFLEWAEFLGHLYGTPNPEPPDGCDVLLEIDVQGARQVVAKRPGAIVILLMPPSTEVQERRLESRGDPAAQVAARIEKGRQEVREARELSAHEVVNDDVDRATTEVAGIVVAARSARLEHS